MASKLSTRRRRLRLSGTSAPLLHVIDVCRFAKDPPDEDTAMNADSNGIRQHACAEPKTERVPALGQVAQQQASRTEETGGSRQHPERQPQRSAPRNVKQESLGFFFSNAPCHPPP